MNDGNDVRQNYNNNYSQNRLGLSLQAQRGNRTGVRNRNENNRQDNNDNNDNETDGNNQHGNKDNSDGNECNGNRGNGHGNNGHNGHNGNNGNNGDGEMDMETIIIIMGIIMLLKKYLILQ